MLYLYSEDEFFLSSIVSWEDNTAERDVYSFTKDEPSTIAKFLLAETTIRNLHVVSREEMQPSDVNPRIRPNTPSLRYGRRATPFSTTGAAHPALHLRLLLLRAGDVELNPEPVCSGCTGTICVGSHPIICTQCQRLSHGYCNGLTRDQQRSPQGYVCGACGSTNGSTIQPSQITRSQPNNTFFCQTNIAVSSHPCSHLPQQTSIPLQHCSTVHPKSEPNTPDEPPRATTVRKCPECKRCLAHVRSPLVCVACRQQFHVKCARETQLALQRLTLQMHGLAISVQRANNQPSAVDRITDTPEQNKHRLTILQWNCDCLTTNVVEPSELTVRYGIEIIALQHLLLNTQKELLFILDASWTTGWCP